MHNFSIKTKTVFIFLLSLIISLIFFEFYLRTTEIMLPSFVYDDPFLGRTHKPNALVNLVAAEGFYMGSINQFGYPDKAYPQEKSPNAFRIALIGDSYIEGFQLFQRNHFSNTLESELSSILNKTVEVLNFGTGGADFRGMFLRYSRMAIKYHPDISLIFIKNEDLLEKDAIPMPEPYLINDTINYSSNFLEDSQSKIRKKFAFVREYSLGNLMKEVYEVYYTGRLPKIILDKVYSLFSPVKEQKNNSGKLFTDPFYNLNERILEVIKRENDRGNRIVLVEVEELPHNYKNLIKEFDIPVIKLKDELAKYSIKEIKYWKASGKTGHWNQNAHIIIGKYLVKEILNLLQYH